LRRAITPVAATLLSLFVLLAVNFAVLSPLQNLSIFAALGMVLAFLTMPMRGRLGASRAGLALDLLLCVLTIACCGYLIAQGQTLAQRAGIYKPADIAVGLVGIVLVLEATRRALGWALPILALAFIGYAMFGQVLPDWLFPHRGYDMQRVVAQTFLRTEGVFGTALLVMFTYVYLFVLFGAFLNATGATQYIIDFAQQLFGGKPGGPAKVAVIASGLMGSLSGSAVANAATTGTFTIPMMRSTGFKPYIAGAVEAVASSGGALVPPVMGAGAYMMLEIIGGEITYLTIIKAALIPAILYYLSLFLLVHFYAYRIGALPSKAVAVSSGSTAGGDATGTQPRKWLSLEGLTFFAALGSLMLFLVLGYSPQRAVTYAMGLIMVLAILGPQRPLSVLHRVIALAVCAAAPMILRFTFAQNWDEALVAAMVVVLIGAMLHPYWRGVVLDSLVECAKGGIPLIVASGCVGIIIGLVTLTGIGNKFPSMVIPLAEKNLFLALFTIMTCSIVLGMGLPSAVSYLLLATLVGPVLGALGVPDLAAHMFIFYFGMMSMVTPPVALAAYTTASLAGAGITQTSLAAFRFALVGFTLPYMFVYRPELLLLATPDQPLTIGAVIYAVTAALIGITALAAAMGGYLFAPLSRNWRIVLYIAAAGALIPDQRLNIFGLHLALFDTLGAILLVVVAVVNWRQRTATPHTQTVDLNVSN